MLIFSLQKYMISHFLMHNIDEFIWNVKLLHNKK